MRQDNNSSLLSTNVSHLFASRRHIAEIRGIHSSSVALVQTSEKYRIYRV